MTTTLIGPAPSAPWNSPATRLPWVGSAAALRLGLLSAASLVTLRAAACAALKSAHRCGRLLEPTLVVGAGAIAVRVVELLGNHPELGLAPRGFLGSRLAEQRTPLPLLGESAELADVARRVIEARPGSASRCSWVSR